MKKRTGLVLGLAAMAVFLTFGALTFFGPATAQANPPGVEPGLKKEFQFNLIGYPKGKSYTGNCGDGSRMFVNRGAAHVHILVTDHNDGWHIEDCNVTDGTGALHTDYTVGQAEWLVYVRILGKPGGELLICADQTTVHDADTDEHLCLLGTIDLHREGGQSKFALQPNSIFDASLFGITWSVDTNDDFRIAQFRVYRVLP